MKAPFIKVSVIVIFFCAVCSCNRNTKKSNNEFVSLDGKKFMQNGAAFFPITLNYATTLNYKDGTFWVGPGKGYADTNCSDRKSGMERLRADMQQIKDMGFNSVRIIGGSECEMKEGGAAITVDQSGKDSTFVLTTQQFDRYLSAFSEMLNSIEEAGLKAILLQSNRVVEDDTANVYLKQFLSCLKDKPVILAWDLFNEPLYFDKAELKKQEVHKIVQGWKSKFRKYDPNHLITIGLTGSRETFEWDPNILDVDFISFHPYEFHKGEVETEIYWFGENVNKPWIIGETGFSADGDSVGYDVQKQFAEKTINRAVDCGASGFSWWQYKDVNWYDFQSNFLGILNTKGSTKTSRNDLIVNGTPKPAALAFKNYNLSRKPGPCDCLPNFYNYKNGSKNVLRGTLKNADDGTPVKNGVIVAWNQYYGDSNVTYSKPDGSFELYADFKMYHYAATATLLDVVKTDIDWDKASTGNVSVPYVDLGVIQLKPVKLNE